MEVMDVGGSWVRLGSRSPWALGNWQLRRVGRQGSCEEVLVQEGLRVAKDSRRKPVTSPSQPQLASLMGRLSAALQRLIPPFAYPLS